MENQSAINTTGTANTMQLRSGTTVNHLQQHIGRPSQPRYRIDSVSDVHNHEANNPDSCPICVEPFNERHVTCDDQDDGPAAQTNQYIIPECNHKFHTSCLMQWFRRERRCPLCRDSGITENTEVIDRRFRGYNYWKRSGSMILIRKVCKRADAPKELVKLLKKRDSFDQKYQEVKKEITKLTKLRKPVYYKTHQSAIKRLRNKSWDYSKKIRDLEAQMSCYKITEIIIRKTQI